MKKFCFIATVPNSVHVFLRDIIQELSKKNVVKVVSNPNGSDVLKTLNAQFVPFNIVRKPSLILDLLILIKFIVLFKKERFDVIHSIMPKTGLLSMMAGFVTRIPIRIHTFTGQVWCNKFGYKRWLLKLADKLLVFCATHILVDSPSQRDFLVNEGILKKNQATVIGNGSICGVDVNQFTFNVESRENIRQTLSENGLPIDDNAIVLLFMARLTKQKGIYELIEAFNKLVKSGRNVYLCLVGYEEDITFNEVKKAFGENKCRVFYIEHTKTPELYFSACDIFCLPSYREGFGQVLIEASACELPIVASHIYGITDSVEDNVTGLLHKVCDVNSLVEQLIKLVDNKVLRKKMGQAGRARVLASFDKKYITQELVSFYSQL